MPKPVSVSSLAEQLGGQNIIHVDDPTNVQQTFFYPSGAISLAMMYDLLAGTAVAGQYMRIVINAASDSDAAGRLGTKGAFLPMALGRAFSQGADKSDPIYRVDIRATLAKSTETTLFTIIGSVLS